MRHLIQKTLTIMGLFVIAYWLIRATIALAAYLIAGVIVLTHVAFRLAAAMFHVLSQSATILSDRRARTSSDRARSISNSGHSTLSQLE